MSDVPSFFAPQRTRSEPMPAPAAPERRVADNTGADFARSLASVRNIERTADQPSVSRATARPAPADDRGDVRADDGTMAVRSRAQVQALMLTGAMKYAATRSSEATGAPASTPSPVLTRAGLRAAMLAGQPIADATTLDAMPEELLVADASLIEDIMASVAADAPLVDTAAPKLPGVSTPPDSAGTIDEMLVAVDGTDDASVMAHANPADPFAAACAAAQLVATLPVCETPAAPEAVACAIPVDDTSNDDALRAAWAKKVTAQSQSLDAAALVEDHFDVPASAQVERGLLPTRQDVVQQSLPAKVSSPGDDMAPDTDAVAAAGTAASATTTRVRRTGGSEIQRDLAGLSPEFRERLQRVIDRMKAEFGHDVTVVETVRSQARQAALYAQGRATPGPVVTWTRNSKHSKGLAADLLVDGAWENPAGYAHLAQVAKQEGLRTLGARDPGHVELPGDGSVSAETLDAVLGDLTGEAGDGARKVRAELQSRDDAQQANAGMARIAEVAQVARVAKVADVARVATVARPGAASSHGDARGADNISPLAVSAPAPSAITDGSAAVRLTSPVTPVNMADRISQLMDLQATQSARPLNSVLLRMDNANGIEDQIRIDTRGTNVDAQLGLGSAQQAAELSARVSELREALERRGLTADGLRVQATPRSSSSDSVQFSRLPTLAIDAAGVRAAADAQAQSDAREQAARDQQQRDAMARQQDRHTSRSSSDDARHRSRREQQETRQ